MNFVCGLVPVRMSLFDEKTAWMSFVSEEETEHSRVCAASNITNSPFLAVEKWMEVLGRSPRPCWVRLRGVPLHLWRESIFRKLGDCLGCTLEIVWGVLWR